MDVPAGGDVDPHGAVGQAAVDEGEQGRLAARLERPFDLLLAPEVDEAARRIGFEDLSVVSIPSYWRNRSGISSS